MVQGIFQRLLQSNATLFMLLYHYVFEALNNLEIKMLSLV